MSSVDELLVAVATILSQSKYIGRKVAPGFIVYDYDPKIICHKTLQIFDFIF